MERLLTDPALARACAAEGIVRARRFSWDASAARLLEAYRVGGREAPGTA